MIQYSSMMEYMCMHIYIYGLWGYGIVGLYVMDHGVISELLYNIGKPMP